MVPAPQSTAAPAGTDNPHGKILQAVVKAGFTVRTDSALCRANEGLYGYVNAANKQFVICTFKEGVDKAEFFDTIRHEAVHVAQICKAFKGGATSALLFPTRSPYFIQRAKDEGWNHGAYHAVQHAVEAEARVVSQVHDAQDITALVNQNCY